MRTVAWLAVAALLTTGRIPQAARADEAPRGPPLADRAKILRTEMRRGPAADLAPYLAPDGDPALRKQAIRALGRIGDRAGAPDWLVKLLGGGADLVEVLQAASLSGAPSLEGPVVGNLASKDPAVQAAAVEALGWIGNVAVGGIQPGQPQISDVAVRCAAACAAMLHSPAPTVRAAALDALARCRQEAYLERVVAFTNPVNDAAIQDAAWFATWMLAGARKRVALAASAGAWDGDLGIVKALTWGGHLGTHTLDLIRPLGILQPLTPSAKPDDDTRFIWSHLAPSADPRVLQEFVARILAARKSSGAGEFLVPLLAHADAKVRQAAAEALGEHGTPQAIAALKARGELEKDERVREFLAAALLRAGDADIGAQGALGRHLRGDESLLRATRVAAATKDPQKLTELAESMGKPPAPPLVLLVALGALEEHRNPAVTGLVGWCLKHADPYVRAAAVGIVGKQTLGEHLSALDGVLAAAKSHAERDVRQAVVEAWAEFVKAGKPDDDGVKAMRARLAEAARTDPAFTARAAARKACKQLNIDGCPDEDPLQPNDWQGLPRPKVAILGLDLTKGGPWLDEAEILQLADRMAGEKPEFVIQNRIGDAEGAFRLAIDPSEAPVHAVSFLLAATSGVYDGTTWHRVVPSFVIQGGDPHGDGSGDAGWSVPDEITRGRFVRGALGMPKGEYRDTGGCQLFVMHSDYRPLDGRYTCYGRVTDGMDTVDKIRVDDLVTGVRMVLADRR